MRNKILVSKNDNQIVVFNKGSKLIINKDDDRFNLLKDLSIEDIEKWYLSR